MKTAIHTIAPAFLVVLLLVLSACGGGDELPDREQVTPPRCGQGACR